MVLLHSPGGDLGTTAPAFSLPDPDGTFVSLDDVRGPNGVVVMFICNHCPYVLAIVDRLAADMAALAGDGVGAVAIMPNDYDAYPADAPALMRDFATQNRFTFAYLVDDTQAVAKAYGAVCTPEFFGFDADLRLVYRGRLDEGRVDAPPGAGAPRELVAAMRAVAGGHGAPPEQHASMGCSIKWRT